MTLPRNYPTGTRFGRLSVQSLFIRIGGRNHWNCLCDCGNQKVVDEYSLKNGVTRSCGCFATESKRSRFITHGHSKKGSTSTTYNSWAGMIQRTTNPKYRYYYNYGGRGISVCDRWKNSFESFLKDMGECPPNKSLDRYPNNDGNYEPGNCRWATRKEQSDNRRVRKDHMDLTGQKFHYLLVLEFSHYLRSDAYWNCICDCGNTKTVSGQSLKRGETKACGCMRGKRLFKKAIGVVTPC